MEVFVFPYRPDGISEMEEIGTICRFGGQFHRFKIFREDSAMIFNHFLSEKTKETEFFVQSGRKG